MNQHRTARYLLLDIEGTTTPISFVHAVLFPYSRQHLARYVRDHASDAAVRQALADTSATVHSEGGPALSSEAATQQLLHWIDSDRKHPALKTLQGLIWEHGYRSREYTSELYPDVVPMLTAWRQQGLKLGIYSSGSVHAQKLLFEHTPNGDLRALFSDFFDTSVGGKKEADSYRTIAAHIQLPPAEILFLSDAEAELAAAASAGCQVLHIVRPGTIASAAYPGAADFYAVATLLNAGQGGRS